MKKTFTGFLTALTMIVLATIACADGPPVQLTQTLTGYSKGATEVKLEYAVEVLNREDAALNNLTLTLVPRPPFVITKRVFTLKNLAGKGKAELKLQLVTRQLLEESQFSKKALLWAGKYLDANGNLVQFPVKSRPGGAP